MKLKKVTKKVTSTKATTGKGYLDDTETYRALPSPLRVCMESFVGIKCDAYTHYSNPYLTIDHGK
ncbi:hypothetical protein CHS0354_040875 [Potamilus streckersoni]|uniref:Uncharacterized protein n=1 Tax=Potamilus streckersoni TaxID=2493646 RepID=A0AAE0VYP5_9BIVA|nr:hypothetical protein CHS0354_040875 [Potamilus streckersoni]